MSINLLGILRDPMGNVMPNANIRFTSTQGAGEMVAPTFATFTTDGSGNYNFAVVDGVYYIEVLQQNANDLDEYKVIGNALVNANTPTPMSLGELLQYTTPIPPQDLIKLEGEWDTKFNDLFSHYATITQNITDQLVDGDAFAIRSMSTYTNDVLGAQAAVLRDEIGAGNAQALELARVYTDTAGNEIAEQINAVATSASNATSELTAYKKSNGDAQAQQRIELEAADGQIVSDMTVAYKKYTDELDLRISDALYIGEDSITSELGINRNELGKISANWQVETNVGDITSSIGLVNDGISSELYIVANKFSFTDGTTNIKPFSIVDGIVFMSSVVIGQSAVQGLDTTLSTITGSVTGVSNALNTLDKATGKTLSELYSDQSPTDISGGGFRSDPNVGWGIKSDGTAIFNNGVFRGKVFADELELTAGAIIPTEIDNNVLGVIGQDGRLVQPTALSLGIYGAESDINEQSTTQLSGNYIAPNPGVPLGAGWKINSNGSAIFNEIVARGRIIATSGTFTGTVTANSGSLDNVTIEDTCIIKGTLNAANIEGDVMDRGVMTVLQNIRKILEGDTLYMQGTIRKGIIGSTFDRYLIVSGVKFEHVFSQQETSEDSTVHVDLIFGGNIVHTTTSFAAQTNSLSVTGTVVNIVNLGYIIPAGTSDTDFSVVIRRQNYGYTLLPTAAYVDVGKVGTTVSNLTGVGNTLT